MSLIGCGGNGGNKTKQITPPVTVNHSELDGLWLHEDGDMTILHVTENGQSISKFLDGNNNKVLDTSYSLSGDKLELKVNDEFNNLDRIITFKKEGDQLININGTDKDLFITNNININQDSLDVIEHIEFGIKTINNLDDFDMSNFSMTDLNHNDDSFKLTEKSLPVTCIFL